MKCHLYAAFDQGLHFLLRNKIKYFGEIIIETWTRNQTFSDSTEPRMKGVCALKGYSGPYEAKKLKIAFH